MIAAVLDTNTLVSALLVPRGTLARLLRAAYERDFACIASVPIMVEVLRALSRPRVQRRYRIAAADIERLRRFLRSNLVSRPITVQIQGVATHPEDDLILATAVSAKADYLVTFDRQLLRLGSYQGVRIVSPHQFAALLAPAPD